MADMVPLPPGSRPLPDARQADVVDVARPIACRSGPSRFGDHEHRGRHPPAPRTAPAQGQGRALDLPVEGALRRGHHLRPLHRLRRLRDRVPARRDRLRPRAGRLQAVPPRGGARARPTAATARRAAPVCTRACPRFRAWEPEVDEHLFGRDRADDEVAGIYKDILLARASDDMVHEMGQDGGLVSAILIWALEKDYIDAALVLVPRGRRHAPGRRCPGVAATRDEVLAAAGSRYTYSANTLAFDEAMERGLAKLALVGMSCQSSVPPVMRHRKVGKVAQADRVQHRPAVLEDLRRRHLRGALRGEVRPARRPTSRR